MINFLLFYIFGTPKVLVISSGDKVIYSKPEEIKTLNIHSLIAASGLVPVRKMEVSNDTNNDIEEINHRYDAEGYDDPHDRDDK